AEPLKLSGSPERDIDGIAGKRSRSVFDRIGMAGSLPRRWPEDVQVGTSPGRAQTTWTGRQGHPSLAGPRPRSLEVRQRPAVNQSVEAVNRCVGRVESFAEVSLSESPCGHLGSITRSSRALSRGAAVDESLCRFSPQLPYGTTDIRRAPGASTPGALR